MTANDVCSQIWKWFYASLQQITLFSQHTAQTERSWENCNCSHTYYISHEARKQCCDAVILKFTAQFHFLQRGREKIAVEKNISSVEHHTYKFQQKWIFSLISRLAMSSGGPETMLMDGVLMLLNVIFFTEQAKL